VAPSAILIHELENITDTSASRTSAPPFSRPHSGPAQRPRLLIRTTRWLRWYRHFGPLSGSDAKLADPLERYLLVALTYGCNFGPSQAARHLRGLVSAHELSFTIRRHVTLEQLNKAITEVVNAYQVRHLCR
jgi:hypothetical protein